MAMHTAPQLQSSAPTSESQHLELEAPVAAHLVGVNSGWRKLLLQAEIVAPITYDFLRAVRRHGLSAGANPARQLSFQPVAIGAAAEATKRPEPPV
jgi:hypothetical protein